MLVNFRTLLENQELS